MALIFSAYSTLSVSVSSTTTFKTLNVSGAPSLSLSSSAARFRAFSGDPAAESSSPITDDSDPPRNEDEWGGGNGSPSAAGADTELANLKRCLVDTVYGTDFGFRASAEVRAEVTELVNQLEALNPTPAPVETPGLLQGNWVLLNLMYIDEN